MTREEALKILPDMKGAGEDWDKAIEIAIKALEAEPSEDTIGVNLHVAKISKHCSDFSDLDEAKPCEDTISRQAAIERLKKHRKIFCKNHMEFTILSDKDKARVDEIDNAIATLFNLPSAQPDYTAIKYEIQRNIDDFYNSKHHAQHVSNNGRMIAFGLELALDIVKDVERREDDK